MTAAERLDATFAALADPTRRAILARLAAGEASVTELAEPFAMSQPAISKHLKVLERAGLISRGRDAQRRPCRLEAEPLAAASGWLERYRRVLGRQLPAPRHPARRDEADARRAGAAKRKGARDDPDLGTCRSHAPGDREIVMTREFDAPRRLVFDAYTKPELLKRWLGVRDGWTLAICEVDLRVGGALPLRVAQRGPAGRRWATGGVFREIVPPSRFVSTETFDDAWYQGEAVEHTVFAERDGRRRSRIRRPTSRARRAMACWARGMERGVAESYDVLAALLAESAAAGGR